MSTSARRTARKKPTKSTGTSARPNKKSEHWQVVENVVAAIERVRGQGGCWTVRQNAMVRYRVGRQRRQVDVFLVCPSGENQFRVGVDIKAVNRPLDVETIEQLGAKASKLDLDRYVVVSTSGFTAEGREEALRWGIHLQTLDAVNASAFFLLAHMQVTSPRMCHVHVTYADGAPRPPESALPMASIRLDGRDVPLAQFAEGFVLGVLRGEENCPIGVVRQVRVSDTTHLWKKLVVGDQEWDPPIEVLISFELETRLFPGRTFRTEDDREAFTVQIPAGPDGALMQYTFVTIPDPAGGCRIALTAEVAKPPRVDV